MHVPGTSRLVTLGASWLQPYRDVSIIARITLKAQCPKVLMRTSRGETSQVCYYSLLPVLFKFTTVYKTDGDQTQSAPNRSSQPSQGESSFGDSSGPLFSTYSKASKEADNKMVERWQKDADGILIFVSSPVDSHVALCINRNTIDWFILCCSRGTPWRDYSGPEAKQPGYLSILPWKHL